MRRRQPEARSVDCSVGEAHRGDPVTPAWTGDRWRGFRTAAEVWQGHRAGRLDVDRFGVDVDVPVGAEWFVRSYVFRELAYRMKDELLLWTGGA